MAVRNYTFYLCRCIPNDKVYVGITCQPFEVRRSEHLKGLATNDAYSRNWMDDWRTFGADAFEWHVLEKEWCTTSEALRKEAGYIDQFNAEQQNFGYNGGCEEHLREFYVEPDPTEFLSVRQLRPLLRQGLVMYHDFPPAGVQLLPGGWLGQVVSIRQAVDAFDRVLQMEYLHDDGKIEEWEVDPAGDILRCGRTGVRVLARLLTDDERTRWTKLVERAKQANHRTPFPGRKPRSNNQR